MWAIHKGEPRPKSRKKAPLRDVEPLTFNNPYGYDIERVWFDGKVIYASEQGELDIDETKVKVAQEYQIVYAVTLNAQRKLAWLASRPSLAAVACGSGSELTISAWRAPTAAPASMIRK